MQHAARKLVGQVAGPVRGLTRTLWGHGHTQRAAQEYGIFTPATFSAEELAVIESLRAEAERQGGNPSAHT